MVDRSPMCRSFIKNLFYLSTILLLMTAFTVVSLEAQRPRQIDRKVLENLKSLSYVPFPFPQNDQEVIADLKQAIKVHFGPLKKQEHVVDLSGQADEGSAILYSYLKDNTSLYVKEIDKVYNYLDTCRNDFHFLVLMADKKSGEIIARVLLEDNGLYASAIITTSKTKYHPLVSLEEARSLVSPYLSGTDKKLSGFRRVVFPARLLGDFLFPLWEITTECGYVYYITYIKDVYRLESEAVLSKEELMSRYRPYQGLNANKELLVQDLIGSRGLVLKKLN